MKNNNYPDVSYQNVFDIYTIGQEIRKNPAYLNDSPYSDSVKKALKLIFQSETKQKTTSTSAISSSDLDELNLELEVKNLYMQTKELLYSENLDEKDKASIQKTAASQLEKLLDMAERSKNLRYIKEFESKVLSYLKKAMPEQREFFMKTLIEGEATNAK